MSSVKLPIACAGLGRMGQRHALHLLNLTPRAQLVAVFSPAEHEQKWAKEVLGPHGVKLYTDYQEMLKHEGLKAVLIATVTAVHAEQIEQAVAADMHVICEKPLSISLKTSQKLVELADANPHLKVMCGFSRRFDASYRNVARKIQSGAIGRPTVFSGQTGDKLDPSGFFVQYAQFSGGIFVDCTIHDCDLAFWFFGADAKVRSVVASGVAATQPQLRQYNDCDNAVGIVEFYGGQIAYFFVSRMIASGQHDYTNILGTKGSISVNINPTKDHVVYHGSDGVSHEIPQTYFERFERAFVTEVNEFTAACLDGTPVPLHPSDAVRALRVASALQESMNSGEKIYFSESTQERIEKANL